MSETEEKYREKVDKDFFDSLPCPFCGHIKKIESDLSRIKKLAGVTKTTMITWRDPKKEKPEDRDLVIVICQTPDEKYWAQGFWLPGQTLKHDGIYYEEGWYEWNADEHIRLVNVVKWGSFELPEVKA